MPLVQTRGAASAQGFGEFAQAAVAANFIEDVFSTYLYTGTGSALTITNGIDLAGKGGLVWVKPRDGGTTSHALSDTVTGRAYYLQTNSSGAQGGPAGSTRNITSFNSDGFSLGTDYQVNFNATDLNTVSWTFREQPKFFDVVTYTGTGSNTTIAHSLGSVPGSIIVKRTDTTTDWAVYHRSLANTQYLVLNTTAAAATGATWWNSTTPTSAVFSVGTDASVNASGGTYVAYLFAHDAGGFGTAGTDNVISCGSFTTDGSGVATVSLGYEPQWVLAKKYSSTGSWFLLDTMRGWINDAASSASGQDKYLLANSTNAESNYQFGEPNATGFRILEDASSDYIYVAIRRGPMKVPTLGTSVYQANIYTGNATADTTVAGNFGFPVDLLSLSSRDATATNFSLYGQYMIDRLRGKSVTLGTATTTGDTGGWGAFNAFDVKNSIGWGLYGASSDGAYMNNSGGTFVARGFRRAPSFFDEVCYTGTGGNQTVAHNLGVIPSLIFAKSRSSVQNWGGVRRNSSGGVAFGMSLNLSNALQYGASYPFVPGDISLTATTFNPQWFENSSGTSTANDSAVTYVAYLFATLAGVSKVGSYTGTGAAQTIDCGFTTGARFVLIKRADSTGDWYVWDSARGIVAGNDSYLLLNSTAAEVTSTDYIDTYSAGFEISSTAPAAINANGGSFIFFAVA